MSNRSGLLLIAVISLSGCATTELVETSSNLDPSSNAPMVAANTESAEETPAADNSDSDDPNQIVCKDTVVTGSNISRIVCLRKYEWEKLERESKQYIKDIQRRATHGRVN